MVHESESLHLLQNIVDDCPWRSDLGLDLLWLEDFQQLGSERKKEGTCTPVIWISGGALEKQMQ